MLAAHSGVGIGIGFLAGLGASVVAAFIVGWIFRPRVKLLGICAMPFRHGTRGGSLHKIVVELRGRSSPGWCCLEISWLADESRQADRTRERVFAKWDETAVPCENNDPLGFRPERVPATYFQPLILHRSYAVPIVFRAHNTYDVFSGWWYGKELGHKLWAEVEPDTELRLTLSGEGIARWTKDITVREVVADDSKCPELDPQ